MGIFGASLLPSAAVNAVAPDQGPMSGDYPYAMPQMPVYKAPGVGRSIIGGIGDALQEWAGGHATFAPEVQRQRQYAQALQQAQLQRAQQFADQKALYDYKAAHPEPNDFTQRYQALNGIKPGLGDTYAENYAANGGGMPQITTIPGVGTFAIPRTPAAATPSIPDAAVSYLRSNPNTAALFDQKYGAGASQRYLAGGAASQGAATFP